MACEDLQAQVAALQQQLLTENQEAAALPKGPDRTQLLTDIKEHLADLAAAKRALADCLATAPPPPPLVPVVAAPRDILEIQWTNHQPPDQSRHDWAAQVVGGSATKFFPDIDFEWVNVLDPTQEYDDPPVGATGWVISPDVASRDVPFLHPFGNDFEFYLALDVPRDGHPEDADYSTLLAPGNDTDEVQRQRASDLHVPPAVLGVEMDGGLVPFDVLRGIKEGDRAAVFGRWIIDTGHYVKSPDGSTAPDPGFRSEIHPPLLMACANIHPSADPDGLDVTRAIFTSRPYLVGQTFSDLDSIYADGIDDDGALAPHLKSELRRALTDSSVSVEAHTKIKSRPFLGAHLMHMIVRPPAPPVPVGPLPDPALTLSISFNFTIRNGSLLAVSTDGTAVHLEVTMFDSSYTPPPLPQRFGKFLSREEIEALEPEVSGPLEKVDIIAGLVFVLSPLGWGSIQGVNVDTYVAPNDAALRQDGAVIGVSPGTLPQDRGIKIDDSQPYPLTGWLEVGWQVVPPTNAPTDEPPPHKPPHPPFHGAT